MTAARHLRPSLQVVEPLHVTARGPSEHLGGEQGRSRRNFDAAAFGAKLATDAVDTLYALAGANGLYTRGPMERIFRDQHAAAGHINFSMDAQASAWGLAALGGPIASPTL